MLLLGGSIDNLEVLLSKLNHPFCEKSEPCPYIANLSWSNSLILLHIQDSHKHVQVKQAKEKQTKIFKSLGHSLTFCCHFQSPGFVFRHQKMHMMYISKETQDAGFLSSDWIDNDTFFVRCWQVLDIWIFYTVDIYQAIVTKCNKKERTKNCYSNYTK